MKKLLKVLLTILFFTTTAFSHVYAASDMKPTVLISMNIPSGIVKIRPIARRFDESGYELQQIDDGWSVVDKGTSIEMKNIRTDHMTTIPKAFITGFGQGYLMLNVQLFISGNRVWLQPIGTSNY